MSGALRLRGFSRLRRFFSQPRSGLRVAGAVASLRFPLQKWSVRRRLMACVAIAAGTFVLMTSMWRAFDLGGRATNAAAIDALEQRLRESRTKLDGLPRLREQARARTGPAPTTDRSPGGDWGAVAGLAARTGVTLRALSPASASGASASTSARNAKPAARVLHIDGRADFPGLYAFFQELSTLPMLAVPAAVSVTREADALAFAATLNVFDTLPAAPASSTYAQAAPDGAANDNHKGRQRADPFRIGETGQQADASAARLVGLMHDSARSLALLEGASGVQGTVAEPGQMLGTERIVSIGAFGVTLASQGGTRRIALSEVAQ
jgi:hypothetical protein